MDCEEREVGGIEGLVGRGGGGKDGMKSGEGIRVSMAGRMGSEEGLGKEGRVRRRERIMIEMGVRSGKEYEWILEVGRNRDGRKSREG